LTGENQKKKVVIGRQPLSLSTVENAGKEIGTGCRTVGIGQGQLEVSKNNGSPLELRKYAQEPATWKKYLEKKNLTASTFESRKRLPEGGEGGID